MCVCGPEGWGPGAAPGAHRASPVTVFRKMVQSRVGDSFYIRTHFELEASPPSGLGFTRGDVFHVLDTLYPDHGQSRARGGHWLAVRMGRDLREQERGIIPNQSRCAAPRPRLPRRRRARPRRPPSPGCFSAALGDQPPASPQGGAAGQSGGGPARRGGRAGCLRGLQRAGRVLAAAGPSARSQEDHASEPRGPVRSDQAGALPALRTRGAARRWVSRAGGGARGTRGGAGARGWGREEGS